jgi:hypothetical protein
VFDLDSQEATCDQPFSRRKRVERLGENLTLQGGVHIVLLGVPRYSTTVQFLSLSSPGRHGTAKRLCSMLQNLLEVANITLCMFSSNALRTFNKI